MERKHYLSLDCDVWVVLVDRFPLEKRWRPTCGGVVHSGGNIAQVINISMNVSEPSSPMLLVYDVVRYIPPGVLWGYLYWRNGFATAEIASVGTHPFLQPFLGVLIS